MQPPAKKALERYFTAFPCVGHRRFLPVRWSPEGTGLGLSLSYDIIKAHGGEIKVETKEGEGAEFVILIPVA
jgi:signal transduction histidine kinase